MARILTNQLKRQRKEVDGRNRFFPLRPALIVAWRIIMIMRVVAPLLWLIFCSVLQPAAIIPSGTTVLHKCYRILFFIFIIIL